MKGWFWGGLYHPEVNGYNTEELIASKNGEKAQGMWSVGLDAGYHIFRTLRGHLRSQRKMLRKNTQLEATNSKHSNVEAAGEFSGENKKGGLRLQTN